MQLTPPPYFSWEDPILVVYSPEILVGLGGLVIPGGVSIAFPCPLFLMSSYIIAFICELFSFWEVI